MRDAIPFVDHFDHLHATQLPDIEWLAAGRGIKCGAIQIDALLVRTRVHHASPEFGEVAVLVIEALRHWARLSLYSKRDRGRSQYYSPGYSDIVLLPLEMPDGMVTLI